MASRLRRRIGTYFAAAGSVAGTTGGGAVGAEVVSSGSDPYPSLSTRVVDPATPSNVAGGTTRSVSLFGATASYQCYKTIQYAIDDWLTTGGRRIVVKDGTYTESKAHGVLFINGISIRVTATSGSPVVLQAENQNGAIIDQGNTSGVCGIVSAGSSYLTVRGFLVRNCYNSMGGIVLSHEGVPSDNCTVERCSVSSINGPGGENIGGIYIGGLNNGTVRNNTVATIRVGGSINQNGCCIHGYDQRNTVIENNDLSDAYTAIFHKRSSGNTNPGLTIRWNYIHAVGLGVRYSIGGAGDPGHYLSSVYENVIVTDASHGESEPAAVMASLWETGTQSTSLTVRNNTFVGGMCRLSGFRTVTIRDNIQSGRIGPSVEHYNTTNFTLEITTEQYNTFATEPTFYKQRYVTGSTSYASLAAWQSGTGLGTSDAVRNPLFVGTSGVTGYQLQAGSSERNAGSDGYDRGAYRTRTETIGTY